jgi:hypothetical protein
MAWHMHFCRPRTPQNLPLDRGSVSVERRSWRPIQVDWDLRRSRVESRTTTPLWFGRCAVRASSGAPARLRRGARESAEWRQGSGDRRRPARHVHALLAAAVHMDRHPPPPRPPARRVGGWPAAGGPGVTGNRAHGRVRCTTYPCADGNTRGGGGGRRTFGGTHAWWVCLLRRGDDTGRCSACGVCLKARINLVFVSRLAVPCIGYVHKSTRINGSSQNRCSQVFVNARSLVVTRVQVTPQVLSPHSSREWIS